MDGMKALKAAVIGMGVLIVLGTVTLVVVAVDRTATAPAPGHLAARLAVPAGSRIVGIAALGPRLAIALHGGGPDRVVLIDPATGHQAGRITLGPAR